MKRVYQFNIVIYVITLFLYLTVIYGMLFQIALGFIQVVTSFIILMNLKSANKKSELHLFIYYCILIVYAIVFKSIIDLEENYWIIIAAMPIATYFLYVLKIAKDEL